MLCKKIVSFFSLLSQSQESGSRKLGITQELLSLVTGLAHYLKILIRIALTAALKLEREFSNSAALAQFLGRLDRLARDPDVVKPVRSNEQPSIPRSDPKKLKPFGYRSLQRGAGAPVGQREATTDLCEGCRSTIEEECARIGSGRRWHLSCLVCSSCSKAAAAGKDRDGNPVTATILPVRDFRIAQDGRPICAACSTAVATRDSFEAVTRLEQYAFLLCVALNKLYDLLKARGAKLSQLGASAF